MKNLVLAFMAMIMLSGITTNAQERDDEILRSEFATIYAEPILEINEFLDNNFENVEKVTFDEFVNNIPDYNKISKRGKILIERAFNKAKKNPTQEQIVASFGLDEMYSMAVTFNSPEFSDLTADDAVKLLLLDNPDDDFDVEAKGFWGSVWNGIKRAAKWVWDNSGTILNIVRIFTLIF